MDEKTKELVETARMIGDDLVRLAATYYVAKELKGLAGKVAGKAKNSFESIKAKIKK